MNFFVDDSSKELIDIYSFSHISHGILFYFIFQYFEINFLKGLYLTIILEILWEIVENTDYIIKKYRKKYENYDGDSNLNIFGDIICTMIGYILAHKIPYLSIVFLIISEILLIPYKANFLQLSIGSLLKN